MQPIDRDHPSVSPEPEAPAPLPVPAARDESRFTGPPPDVAEDARRLHDWLLDLADEDLAGIVGSSTLDRYVAKVLAQLGPPTRDQEGPPREVSEFLGRLNKRILGVRIPSK